MDEKSYSKYNSRLTAAPRMDVVHPKVGLDTLA